MAAIRARGEYLVLLNNDVVVTDGWLDQLVALATAQPLAASEAGGPTRGAAIGLVGPMSNYATPPRLVENVPYHGVPGMHGFARRWREEHRGKWFIAHKLSGFCLLMKRVVYETIGGLDERFGIGFFDDDDLAERARRAGFELAVAHDLFVHHFGSRTFQGNGVDAEALLDENARRFADKWGSAASHGKRVALRPWSDVPAFFAESQREFAREVDDRLRARTSLTMIVRDEEDNLSRCLESVREVFDEIVVVDTGSVDRTKEIAREFGRRPGVRWTYRVHEQILPSLNRAKVPVRWTDLIVRHTGYCDPVVEARKLERNIKILRRELGERPDEPFVLFNLGSSAVDRGEWNDPGIYGHLTRRKLAALATERGDHAEAERLWNDVLAECPGDRDATAKLERFRRAALDR